MAASEVQTWLRSGKEQQAEQRNVKFHVAVAAAAELRSENRSGMEPGEILFLDGFVDCSIDLNFHFPKVKQETEMSHICSSSLIRF